uniref:CCDC113/CCDC96 coiled-coil domain-containing protein n=1 Tax=Ciona savignyi TaxID=51511 RepID=H2ZR54_CIOSA
MEDTGETTIPSEAAPEENSTSVPENDMEEEHDANRVELEKEHTDIKNDDVKETEESKPSESNDEELTNEEPAIPNEPITTTDEDQQVLQSGECVEADEGGLVIGEVLSRQPTPPLAVEEEVAENEIPQPGTPDQYGSDEGEVEILLEEEEEIMSPQINREELLQKYQVALNEREQLSHQNHQLQHKLAEYFRKKKTEETRQEVDKNVTDQEQRYFKYMSNLEELRQQQTAEQETYNEQLEELKARKAEKHGKVEEEWSKAIEFKRAVAAVAINSRSGRIIPQKDVEVYEANERKKEAEVSQVRLENIKLKNRLKKQEIQLKQKEELAEGLHLIDFEQLKIENQTYNEKIEERNEELLKLRKKITSTVQVLTHLKEKLQFVQAENHVRKSQLAEVEQKVAQKRDILSRTKQARDALRHDNAKFQQKSGLLGNTDLLRDFEVGSDEAEELQFKLEQMKRQHAELTLSLNGVKKKIDLAKENQT